jgi:hypothetical protein
MLLEIIAGATKELDAGTVNGKVLKDGSSPWRAAGEIP